MKRFLRGLGFGSADVSRAVEDLPLQVRKIDGVEIYNADPANACGGKIHGDRRTQPAGADTQNTGRTNFLLPNQSYFGQTQMPRVTAEFVGAEFHTFITTGQCEA